MSVLERGAGRLAVILEQQDVAEAAIVLQVEHAIAVGPENLFDRFLAQVRERLHVVRRFDDHFVRAHAVHAIEQAFALAIKATFNSQSRKLIRDNAQRPARRVFSCTVAAVGENFRRRLAFIAGAERTSGSSFDLNAFANEIEGPLPTLGGNDYPAPRDWIPAKLRQTSLLVQIFASLRTEANVSSRLQLFYYAILRAKRGYSKSCAIFVCVRCLGVSGIGVITRRPCRRRICGGARLAFSRRRIRWPARRSGSWQNRCGANEGIDGPCARDCVACRR